MGTRASSETRERSPRPSWRGRAKEHLQRLRRANRLVYRPGARRVSIDRLISPLRYDIIVRADYFRFLIRHWDLFEHDFAACVAASRGHPYFVWFTEIHCGRLHPNLLRDEETLDAAFRWRIRRSADLLRRFRREGFDPRPPILLRRGRRIGPGPTGKAVVRDLYVGDGCHRLALLKFTGHRWLEPGMYIVRTHRAYAPPDNTSILLGHLGVSEREYLRFLSLGYADVPHETREDLVNHVRGHDPDRLSELMEVITIDEGRLTTARSA